MRYLDSALFEVLSSGVTMNKHERSRAMVGIDSRDYDFILAVELEYLRRIQRDGPLRRIQLEND